MSVCSDCGSNQVGTLPDRFYDKKDAVKFGRHIGTTELDVKIFFFKSFSGEKNIYLFFNVTPF